MTILRHGCLLLVAALCLTGCSGRRDMSVELLERENRILEDLIWQWHDAYEAKCAELDSCKHAYRSPTNDANETLPNPARTRPASDRSTTTTHRPESDGLEMPLVEGPAEEIPAPANRSVTPGGPKDDGKTSRLPTPPIRSGASRRRKDVSQVAAGDIEGGEEVDANVVSIVLNKQLTGGYDFDDKRTGDEGVMVVIEPRNSAGCYVPVPGPVTVIVMDPAAEADAQKVARWEFDAADATKFLRKSAFGRGFHMELHWPGELPAHRALRVVARYQTADGRTLETFKDIEVDLAGSGSSGRWTPMAPVPGERDPASPRELPVPPTSRGDWSLPKPPVPAPAPGAAAAPPAEIPLALPAPATNENGWRVLPQ